MIEKDIKEKIIRLLDALHPGVKIYLFGSHAKGSASESSDIDLALDIGQKMEGYDITRARNVLEAASMPYKIDVVDLNRVPEYLKEEILKNGILWKK